MKKLSRLLFILLLAFAAGCAKDRSVRSEHPEWSYNAVMYELNTRQFTEEGTFTAAAAHLPRLADLGVDIIWLMPIHPIGVTDRKGELGSYYSITDYKAVNPEFGTLDDFRVFVADAHSKGFRVIMDWVANHTARDARWIGTEGWYVLGDDGLPVSPYDWTDVAQLDFTNDGMRAAMTDAMLYWVLETDIDGYRCDFAGDVPTDFWADVIEELKKVKPDFFMLAEAEKPELHTLGGFDASYAWELHHIMNKIAGGEYNADSLRTYLAREKRNHPKSAIRLNFTSNHDENSWNGTEFERMGDAAKPFAAMTYVMPGMPLIYNGQEVGFDRRLEFFRKDVVDWSDLGGFTPFYRTLNAVKHRCPAIAAGERGGDIVELANSAPERVFSFSRTSGASRIVAVFNLSPDAVETAIDFNGAEGAYINVMSDKNVILESHDSLTLEPWEYIILEN